MIQTDKSSVASVRGLTYAIRSRMSEEHPLLSQKYTIPTPDIDRLGSALRLWHRAGLTGGLLLGPTRVGKTNAVDDCIQHIAEILPARCFAARINWILSTRPTERRFFGRILEGLGYGLIQARSSETLERCLVERLMTQAYESGGRRYLLFIDDAHNLNPIEYQWLCHVFNELHDRGVDLMVLLIGQPELRGERTLFREGGDTQVVGRFMRAEFVFEGINDHATLQRLLAWIDDQSEFPTGSRQSYLSAFLPRALERGFRLDRFAGRLWSAYLEWKPTHKADEHAGISPSMSMMTFSAAVTTLVQELAERDDVDLKVEDDLLAAVMRLVAAPHG